MCNNGVNPKIDIEKYQNEIADALKKIKSEVK